MSVMSETMECPVCPHHCRLKPGQVGICRTRTLQDGKIVSLTYGEVAAWHLDPIEKKPLYHFYPGSWIFSVGAYGCNLKCFFCQNHEISQTVAKGYEVTPEQLAELSVRNNSIGICFTYSEPLMWYEMILDTAPLVKKRGGKVVLVSNGIIAQDYLEKLIPFLDAANIDIKAFSDDFYKRHTKGRLKWVLDTVEKLVGRVHTEVTTLVIPTLNDDPEQIKELAEWLAALPAPIAWHLSRYFPRYKSAIPATDPTKLQSLAEIAQSYLPYVYLGNVAGKNNTYCPQCGLEVISRGWKVGMQTKEGKCLRCGRQIWGIGLN